MLPTSDCRLFVELTVSSQRANREVGRWVTNTKRKLEGVRPPELDQGVRRGSTLRTQVDRELQNDLNTRSAAVENAACAETRIEDAAAKKRIAELKKGGDRRQDELDLRNVK